MTFFCVIKKNHYFCDLILYLIIIQFQYIMKGRISGIIVLTLVLCGFLISVTSCAKPRESREEKSEIQKTEPTAPVAKPRVNVYIENSGSMDGFILNGLSDFKNVVGKLLVDLKYNYSADSVQIFFIRNEIDNTAKGSGEKLIIKRACETNISDYASAIDLKWKEDINSKKRGKNTKLNNIFKTILDSTQENTISILISDCVYSIGKEDALKSLNEAENTTYNAFLMKLKNEQTRWATMIVQMSSDFKGKYFPYTDDKDYFMYEGQLPYYICVFASQENLSEFNRNNILKQTEDKGYQNKYILSSEDKDAGLYYSVLPYTMREGRFKSSRSQSSTTYVHGIEDIDVGNGGSGCSQRRGEGGKLQLAVAVDLSNINVDNSYLLDTANYFSTDEKFKVLEIKAYNKDIVNATDRKMIEKSGKKPTHIIVLSATGTSFDNFSIGLKRQMPSWIDECSILDDTRREKIENGKSFGLKYWVSGIADAYKTHYKNSIASYFELEIKINQ